MRAMSSCRHLDHSTVHASAAAGSGDVVRDSAVERLVLHAPKNEHLPTKKKRKFLCPLFPSSLRCFSTVDNPPPLPPRTYQPSRSKLTILVLTHSPPLCVLPAPLHFWLSPWSFQSVFVPTPRAINVPRHGRTDSEGNVGGGGKYRHGGR